VFRYLEPLSLVLGSEGKRRRFSVGYGRSIPFGNLSRGWAVPLAVDYKNERFKSNRERLWFRDGGGVKDNQGLARLGGSTVPQKGEDNSI